MLLPLSSSNLLKMNASLKAFISILPKLVIVKCIHNIGIYSANWKDWSDLFKMLRQEFHLSYKISICCKNLYLFYRQTKTTFKLFHAFGTYYNYKKQSSRGFLGKGVLPMPKCDFNKVVLPSKATLLKSHFGIGILLYICCIFSKHLLLKTSLEDCVCITIIGHSLVTRKYKNHNRNRYVYNTVADLKNRPVCLNGWVFVYELSGCGLESRCCHLNFRYGTCFEQGVPWHSGKL